MRFDFFLQSLLLQEIRQALLPRRAGHPPVLFGVEQGLGAHPRGGFGGAAAPTAVCSSSAAAATLGRFHPHGPLPRGLCPPRPRAPRAAPRADARGYVLLERGALPQWHRGAEVVRPARADERGDGAVVLIPTIMSYE